MIEEPRLTQQRRRAAARRKRLFDVALVMASLPLALPVGLLVAACVRLFCGGPVLFRQRRPGLHGRLFTLLKFRTMREALDGTGRPLADSERLTKFGRLLRSTSLDELPELWNVLRGEMSLIGPRPLLVEYLPLYTREQARRHEVLPGITGWAQVNGRNAISWEQRFALDVWYVDNHCVALDLKILRLTIRKVMMREGIVHAPDVTMPRFRGTNSSE